MSLLFIGESPSSLPNKPLQGAIGRRLAELCSTTPGELQRRVDRHNLVPEVLATWDRKRACRNAAFLMYQLGTYDAVVICGRKVASAFGLDRAEFLTPNRLANGHYPEGQPGGPLYVPTFYVLPHPSGRNLWYNNPKNVEKATTFLTELYQRYGAYVRQESVL